MTAAARAVLLALKHAETDPVSALAGALELLREVLAAEDGERVLSALVHYTFRTGAEPARIFELARKIDARVATMAMTAADKLIQEGLERGRQEGRQEGGLEAQRTILLRQLAHRFGVLDQSVVTRVTAASADDLGRWAERLLDVSTLEAVFDA